MQKNHNSKYTFFLKNRNKANKSSPIKIICMNLEVFISNQEEFFNNTTWKSGKKSKITIK